jgi:hypothetical protein
VLVDPEEMWLQPDEMLAPVFWDSVDEETSARFKSLRSPESPQAVLEATRWLAEVDISGINAPAYLMSGGQDKVVPPTDHPGAPCGMRGTAATVPGGGQRRARGADRDVPPGGQQAP